MLSFDAHRYSVESCFASFLLPYLLFADSFEDRRNLTHVVCFAWNVALFGDAALREQHISGVFEEERALAQLRNIVAAKRDLFPGITQNVTSADLHRGKRYDELHVGAVRRELVTSPRPAGAPLILKALEKLRDDTKAVFHLLEGSGDVGRVMNDVEATRFSTIYCIQRSDLMSYRTIFQHWDAEFKALGLLPVMNKWQSLVKEVDELTQAVLSLAAKTWSAAPET